MSSEFIPTSKEQRILSTVKSPVLDAYAQLSTFVPSGKRGPDLKAQGDTCRGKPGTANEANTVALTVLERRQVRRVRGGGVCLTHAQGRPAGSSVLAHWAHGRFALTAARLHPKVTADQSK